ncbi:gliding motility-associated ABC transporter substrate-binding protein GldG [Pleomorphovibrio marinus]|uniref:gliding motility-associated ABC transporter substrate-binding protein GldG n=1 Tax=Pleomorphovibrio marinus TaxID=2164132 RepID=UPI000E0C3558|nr:gliding motility-associated ABC transporter substrate-binding protein GldG [Pleomorphovibrio marinus]
MNANIKIFTKSLLGIVSIWIFAFLANEFTIFRWDLTEEGRYSVSEATMEVLADLEEPLEVEILLTGTLPGGMRRFQKSIEETVKTLNAYSPYPIRFFYQDPLTLPEDIREEYIFTLADYGIIPTNLHASEAGGKTTRMIFPGVVVRNEEYEVGTLLLKGEKGMSSDEILNNSIENLEFEISTAIKRLISRHQHAVGLIIGHGEMEEDEGFGVVEALHEDFEIYKIPMEQAEKVEDLLEFEALIIAGPRELFNEREKFLLDQYLMYGGNLLVFLDPLAVDLKEAGGEGTVAMPYDTGLDDLLFRYGIRVNKDLVQDLNYGYHPVVAGDFGDQPQIVPLPWPFYVLAGRMATHPITKGLDQLQFRFVSTLDTVKADGIRKTPLVFSSDYSKVLNAPLRVAFEDMTVQPDVETFGSQRLPLIYLLEGEFTSYFKNRFIPEGFAKDFFREEGTMGRLLVAGDGSLVKSMVDPSSGEPMPLGEEPFGENMSANRDFLQNAIHYMLNPEGLISTRVKQYQIRPLNRVKIQNQKGFWQVINVAMPIGIILSIGLANYLRRRRKYEKGYSPN